MSESKDTSVNNSKKKTGKTLLLDVKTIEILKSYAEEKLGTSSMSAAVRLMAREYNEQRQRDNCKQ